MGSEMCIRDRDWKRKNNYFSGLCDYDTITENSFLESDKSGLTELFERGILLVRRARRWA